jgi:hypothetical protein
MAQAVSNRSLQWRGSFMLAGAVFIVADAGCMTDGRDRSTGGTVAETPPDETPSCTRDEVYGPEGPTRYYVCRAASFPESWQLGDPTPPGEYTCDCMRLGEGAASGSETVPILDALNCDDALARACNVDTNGPLSCSVDESSCWPVLNTPASWRCGCTVDDALVELSASSCEYAALVACVPHTCSNSSLGSCELLAGEAGYDCNCSDGGEARWSGTPAAWRTPSFAEDGGEEGVRLGPLGDNACEQALSLTCLTSCETPRGACTIRPNGFACMCADSIAGVDVVTTSTNCPAAVATACGS